MIQGIFLLTLSALFGSSGQTPLRPPTGAGRQAASWARIIRVAQAPPVDASATAPPDAAAPNEKSPVQPPEGDAAETEDAPPPSDGNAEPTKATPPPTESGSKPADGTPESTETESGSKPADGTPKSTETESGSKPADGTPKSTETEDGSSPADGTPESTEAEALPTEGNRNAGEATAEPDTESAPPAMRPEIDSETPTVTGSEQSAAESSATEPAFEEIQAVSVPETTPTEPDPPVSAGSSSPPAPGTGQVSKTGLPGGGRGMFRESFLAVRNSMSAMSLNQHAELTYNPKYITSLRLSPFFWLNEQLYANARFIVASELTQADWTRDRVFVGDLQLFAGAYHIYQIPVARIDLSVEGALTFPTDIRSRAESMLLNTGIDFNVARTFPVLKGLTVEYDLALSKYFHRYTTGAQLGRLDVPCLGEGDSACTRAMGGSGLRNVSWDLENSVTLTLQAFDWLSARALVSFNRSQLYEKPDDPEVSLRIDDPVNARYYGTSLFVVSYRPLPMFSASVGALTFMYEQLGQDGSYRTPIFNRYTDLYLDLTLHVAEAVDFFIR